MLHKPYYALSTYLRQRFGRRVQKIPLDAGFSCPNRDGTLSRRGCLFCNAHGSGSGLLGEGFDLAAQWRHWRDLYSRRSKASRFIAYLQSFSNTHGPLSKLQETLEQILLLPDMVGLAVGTRPDCLDRDKLDLLASMPCPPFKEIWLELGLQSANDEVLLRINRGHDLQSFEMACLAAAARGLFICAHLIAGLPGEDKAGFLNSVRTLNRLPIHGVKFHNLYVCSGTPLADMWRQGEYIPMTRERYLEWICDGISLLRPDIVVQRLTGDPVPGELLAPDWASVKTSLLNDIEKRLNGQRLWQGKALHPHEPMPGWFAPAEPPAFAPRTSPPSNQQYITARGVPHAF